MSSNNSTNVTSAGFPWFYDESWNWFMWNIFVWLFPLLCSLGALVNACSFYVIVSNRKVFPYVTRQYMLIITMNDLIIVGFKASTHYLNSMSVAVRFNPWSWYQTPRNVSLAVCIIYNFFTYYTLFGAQFFQLGLTIDRLIAVAAPLKAKYILTRRRSWLLLFIITSMALLLPSMISSQYIWNDKNECGLASIEFLLLVYQPAEFYFGRVFLLAALIAGTAAICLLLVWNNRAARMTELSIGPDGSRERNRSLVRITLILVFLNLLFLATSVPYSAVAAFQVQLLATMGPASFEILLRHCNTLMYANSALNWPLYFMGNQFRAAFARRFAPRCLQTVAYRQYLQNCCCCYWRAADNNPGTHSSREARLEFTTHF